MAKIKITQVRSAIGRNKKQKATLVALGIKKMNGSVVQDNSNVILGMVNRVSHLVKVEEVEA